MKVTFLYTDYSYTNEGKYNIGIGSLSSFLRTNGHETGLIHIKYPLSRKALLAEVSRQKPDIIAGSCISTTFGAILRYLGMIRAVTKIPVILGGVHPTLLPEESIAHSEIDFICRGEGERPLLALVNAMRDGSDPTGIPGIWAKKDRELYRNPVGPLCEDLDSLPFPDREIFNYSNLHEVKYFARATFMATRGCPYNCTYCCNHAIKNIYPNKNKYLRFRSVANLMTEIRQVLTKYPRIRFIRFNDDTLTVNNGWFREFAHAYKKEVNLPFTCMGRINEITDEDIDILADIRCRKIELGVESGNEGLRKELLGRTMSNEKIISTIHAINRRGIATTAFNMTGLPNESMEKYLDTIRLNARANPTIKTIFYYVHFKGTRLYDYALDNGMIDTSQVTSYYEGSTTVQNEYSHEQIVFAVRYFAILIALYRFLIENKRIRLEKVITSLLTSKRMPYSAFNIAHSIVFFVRPLVIYIFYHSPHLYRGISAAVRIVRKTFFRGKMS